tara:strand:+ start:983 stop:1348 length:366 start_codon:yes stop_codon:yes gene_type:complete
MKLTIEEMKENNKANGMHWFSKDTMNFFDSKIETSIYYDRTFITSERTHDSSKRKYTWRLALGRGKDIETIGDFLQFETLDQAIDYRLTEDYKKKYLQILDKHNIYSNILEIWKAKGKYNG